jgi:pimeloyl-ACP methyl ester carboxylesterase
MPYFDWRGRRLHYRETGDPAAPLLVIMPGSTASSANHAGELRHFARTHRVAALDYLGTGQSDRLEPPWPVDWWESGAEQAAALAVHLGAARYALLGCSGGGTTALRAAAEHPDRVTAVVADSCPERLKPDDLRRLAALRLGESPPPEGTEGHDDEGDRGPTRSGGIAEQPFPGSFMEYAWRRGPRLLRRLTSRPRRTFWMQAHGDDWAEVVAADTALLLELADRGGWDPLAGRLTGIRCPVLLTSSLGDEDLPFVVPHHQHMAMQIPDCRLWVTPRGEHPAMWTDKRGFRRRADRFLAGA